MNRKSIITVLLIILIGIPVFALGVKEGTVNNNEVQNSTPAEPQHVQEPVQNQIVKEVSAVQEQKTETISAPVTEETQKPVVSETITSISTPVYKVELTKAETITKQNIDECVSFLSNYYGYPISESDATEYLIDQILLNQELVRMLESGEIPLYDGQFNEYVSYQLATYASMYGINLDSEETANSFLELINMTYEDFANEVLPDYAQEYLIRLNSNGRLENIAEPTEEEIKRFYDSNISAFVGDEAVRLSHIFFTFGENKETALSTATEVYNKVVAGLSFEEAAKRYSEDETSSVNGGILGVWIEKNDSGVAQSFGENALKTIFDLELNSVSPVVEGTQGYHIFKVIARKDSVLLSLDDLYSPNYSYTVREVIAQQLYNAAQQEAYAEILNEFMAGLREKATIKSLI